MALQHLTLSRGQTEVTGDAAIVATSGAKGNFLDGPLAAQLSVKNLRVAPAAREFEIATVASLDADALASATVHLSGTARLPEAAIVLDATQATAFGDGRMCRDGVEEKWRVAEARDTKDQQIPQRHRIGSPASETTALRNASD